MDAEERNDLTRYRLMKVIIFFPKVATTIMLFLDFLISLFWLAEFEAEATEGRSSEVNDWKILIKPLTFGLLGVGLSLSTFVIGLAPVRRKTNPNILLSCLALKFLHLTMDSVNITFPDTAHYVFGILWIFLHISEIAHLLFIIVCFELYLKKRPFKNSIFAEREKPQDLSTYKQFFIDLENWLSLRSDRKMMAKKVKNGRNYFVIICLIMLLLVYSNWAVEMYKMYTKESAYFVENELNDIQYAKNSWPSDITYANFTRVNATLKVVYIIIDGLRLDYSYKNKDFGGFFYTNETFARDSVHMKSRCELPSMSVPNWVTLLTGAPPEMHGTLGNLLIPETHFDSIFREAHDAEMMRGMTGSPWFADIVKEQLPHLYGDGTLDTSEDPYHEEEDRIHHKTAAPADAIRGRLLHEAIQSPLKYQLFLAHFSDVDMEGHYYGVSSKYNKYDSYYKAITNKTEIIKKAVDLLDEDTVLIVTSDHGQVDRGGHGGIEEINMKVPIIFYRKGSGYANNTLPTARFHYSPKNMDLAPTICAILGLPVPRHCNGRFIDKALGFIPPERLDLHVRDLFYQKRLYVNEFLRKTHASNSRLNQKVFYEDTSDWSTQQYMDGVNELIEIWDSQRDKKLSLYYARNIILSILIAPIFFFVVVSVLQFSTACDMTIIIAPWRWNKRKWHNIQAFCVTFAATFVYYFLCILIFIIIYLIVGYRHWDSTIVHDPAVVIKYVIYTVAPSSILAVLYLRAFQLPFSKRPRLRLRSHKSNPFYAVGDCIYQFWMYTIIGTNDSVSNLPVVYLYKYYNLLHAIGSLLFIFVLAGTYTFILPEIWRIHFITKTNWELRFRLFTVQIFAIPLCIAHVLMLFIWPSQSDRKSNWDAVYLMWLHKSGHKRAIKGVDAKDSSIYNEIVDDVDDDDAQGENKNMKKKEGVEKVDSDSVYSEEEEEEAKYQSPPSDDDDNDENVVVPEDQASIAPSTPRSRTSSSSRKSKKQDHFWRLGEEHRTKRYQHVSSIDKLLTRSASASRYETFEIKEYKKLSDVSEMHESDENMDDVGDGDSDDAVFSNPADQLPDEGEIFNNDDDESDYDLDLERNVSSASVIEVITAVNPADVIEVEVEVKADEKPDAEKNVSSNDNPLTESLL